MAGFDEAVLAEYAGIGVTTVYEAAGRTGLLDHEWTRLIDGSAIAGRAFTVLAGQGDNRAIHESVAKASPGDVLVVTMPEPAPVGLIGELLVTQMQVHGLAGIVLDGASRDVDELVRMGFPVWTRWVRSTGATRTIRGTVGEPITVGGTGIRTGDLVIADRDGVVAVPAERVDDVLEASRARVTKENGLRAKWETGVLSYDEYGFRTEDEGA